jgi:DUF4097 and DUF4098 domain-containing protein YvlB
MTADHRADRVPGHLPAVEVRPRGGGGRPARVTGGRAGRVLAMAGGAGALVMVLSGCGSAEADEAPVERKSFAFSGQTLDIDSDNYRLEIVPADVKAVEVTRQVDGWVVLGSGPEKSWKLEDGRLVLKVECDAVVSNCEGKATVKVPRGVTVSVDSDNGDVRASGFSTPLRIGSQNGDITVRETTGTLDLSSDNGSVNTRGVTAATLKARTNNGDVRVGLRAGTAADLIESRSDNGSVTVELPNDGGPYAVEADTKNGEAKVSVQHDPASKRVVNARSNNGDVTVRPAS